MWTQSLLLLLALSVIPSVTADPMYRQPWGRGSRRFTPQQQQQQRQQQSSPPHRRMATPVSYRRQQDYSTKFFEVDEFQRDKKARLWQVNMKTRQPGKYSWTTRLVIANVVCYALQTWNPRFTQMGVKLSDRILRGEQLYRLLTPVFLHGGVAHLAMNMISLRNIGPDVEKLFGPGRFLATYLGAGMAGNLLSAINSPNPALGASGAVFGIIGAQLVFLSRNDWLLGRDGERMQNAIFQTIGLNLVLGMMNPMIDNWGHLGKIYSIV